jgi:hypothetical protein
VGLADIIGKGQEWHQIKQKLRFSLYYTLEVDGQEVLPEKQTWRNGPESFAVFRVWVKP